MYFRILTCFLLLAIAVAAAAQTPAGQTQPSVFGDLTLGRFWIGGQANLIYQQHTTFHSPYQGPNSFHARSEHALSRVFTLFSATRITDHQEIIFDIESAGGRGISDAFGLAGYTDLDVVRNPTLGSKPYIARAQYHAIIPLSAETDDVPPTPLSRFTRVPRRRIEVRVGKMGIVDSFDLNAVGNDSHLQFMNWTIDNNGAYDYAADTRGYTMGAMAEYDAPLWSVRAGVALMPKVANGIKLDYGIRHDRGENLEFEWRPQLLADRGTTARLLLYRNLARMGSYRLALDQRGNDTPDVALSDRPGRSKYGIGISADQELTSTVRAYTRLGWNDGRNESFAYTEVDRTVQVGGDVRPWRSRPHDRIGVAMATNWISGLHRDYLQAGGVGFLLGDGHLRYGPERIVEAYYTAFVGRGLYVSVDVQRVVNPGYNRDRGPVLVPSMRLHVDF